MQSNGIVGLFEYCMQKIKDLIREIRKLSAFKPFQDRQTDIVDFRGTLCNEKGCPMVYWIIGKLYAKT